jgi:hypothetical protein
MVVAYFFTRPMVVLLSRTKRFSGGKVLGVLTGERVGGASISVPPARPTADPTPAGGVV